MKKIFLKKCLIYFVLFVFTFISNKSFITVISFAQPIDDSLNNKNIKRKVIAILKIENKSGKKNTNFESIALNSLTTYLVQKGEYTVVEREKIDEAIKELKFSASGYVDAKSVVEIGKLIGADIVLVGILSSITSAGKSKQYFAKLNIKWIVLETGEVSEAYYSIGTSGKAQADNENALIEKAIDNAAQILIEKLPISIIKIMKSGMVVVNIGKKDGVQENDELPVLKDGEEIGKLKLLKINETTSEGIFLSSAEMQIEKTDKVINTKVKDADFPKSKGSSKILIYAGLGLLVIIAAVAGGSGKKTTTQQPAPANVPPNLPTAKY